jgi:flagellar hook-associated protein 3 FlgL
MRVSNKMIADQAIQYMNLNLERYNDLTLKSASMKNFQKVSDDPATAAAAMTIRSSISTGENYLSNANNVSSWMDTTNDTLVKMNAVIITAQSKVEQGLNDTMSAEERLNSLAPELDTMISEMLNLSNATYMDKYIFSGYQINTKPFEIASADPNTVVYNGDGGIMQQDIGNGQSVAMNTNNSATINSVFSALIRARNALQSNDTTELANSLTDLNTVMNSINDLTSTNGARQRQVKSVIDYLEKSKLTLNALLSEKEDANMAEVAVRLKAQENTYQIVLEVGNRAISALSLFDFLK